jgi:hypothetical protein
MSDNWGKTMFEPREPECDHSYRHGNVCANCGELMDPDYQLALRICAMRGEGEHE